MLNATSVGVGPVVWSSDFLVSLITLLIVAISAIVALCRYFYLNRKPNFEPFLLREPSFTKPDQPVSELRIPNGRIILYFGVRVTDTRTYLNTHAWIKFPLGFEVDHNVKYETLAWGKPTRARTKNQIGYEMTTPITGRPYLDAAIMPVVVNVPNKIDDKFEVQIQFWAESIKSDSVEKSVMLHVVDKNFSHDIKLFNPETFKIKDSN